MKKLLLFCCGLLPLTVWGRPQPSLRGAESVPVEKIECLKVGRQLLVQLRYDLSALQLGRDRALFITPYIVGDIGESVGSAQDSLSSLPSGETRLLPTVGIYGQSRYWYYLRSGLYGQLSPELQFRQGRQPDTLLYRQFVPFEPWMEQASLRVLSREMSCDDCEEDRRWSLLGSVLEATEEAGVEAAGAELCLDCGQEDPAAGRLPLRALESSARIDFLTDRWDILPDYSDNRRELDRIRASIDTVLERPGVQLTGIRLLGHASPEAPYEYNRLLSARRVEAIRDYLLGLCPLDTSMISIATVPEDWEGLRRLVEESRLPEREALLDIIDFTDDPDRREEEISRRYPDTYRMMYRRWYPMLRRTDYRINYIVGQDQ